jgi:hypothetical protein
LRIGKFVQQVHGDGCPSPELDRPDHIDFSTSWKKESSDMLALRLSLFRRVTTPTSKGLSITELKKSKAHSKCRGLRDV